MKNGRRILTLLLAAAMVFALAACGETNVEETEAPEFVYKADYLQVGPVADGASFYPTLATKDAFYSLTWLKTGERELEEGEVLEYDGQLDIYEHQRRAASDWPPPPTPGTPPPLCPVSLHPGLQNLLGP